MSNQKKPGFPPGTLFRTDIADPKERIEAYLNTYRALPRYESFDEQVMSEHLQLVVATSEPAATATFQMRVTHNLCSRMGNMHGGCVSLIFDMCTTMCGASIARPDFWRFGGLSRNLTVNFFRPTKKDTLIEIHCEVIQIGSRLCTIRGEMRDVETKKLLSTAEHTKARLPEMDGGEEKAAL
ncbi:hypothetical protein FE257_005902 [Aspergillus nanangensis]|uniref:Thioesterase domain-containing protein n=1 Tax=Aspergillus nanangensis TaxID=2582783 RepID=A0AAD4CQA7_ASPNN|nr:hypothetical protein FE257_005902 [Aspergillus nanangensis]